MSHAGTYTVALLLALAAGPAWAQPGLPAKLREIGFDQRPGEQVPLDLTFQDETGQPVRLREYLGDKPVILVFAYYRCPMLCTEVLNGLVRTLLDIHPSIGSDFTVLTVSFDPNDTPKMAADKKKNYLVRYGRPGSWTAWHFLTGDEGAIQSLTAAVGFRYSYDAKYDQFSHPSGLVVLTPSGKVARYFQGIDFSPQYLQLGLEDAAAERIAAREEQVTFYCAHYDPADGKYGTLIMSAIRVGGVLTVLGIGSLVVLMWRRDGRKALQRTGTGG